jgi:signal transduction histidine kinase
MENRPIDILMVEDNPADVELMKEALQESKILTHTFIVGDGVEALEFLNQEGKYKAAVRPDLVLLDLNIPKKDGREVLKHMKNDPYLKSIPVVILSSSDSDTDIIKSYNLGANCYITKPIGFEQFLSIIQTIGDFWFSVVKLPSREIIKQYKNFAGSTRTTSEVNPFKSHLQVLLIEDNPGDAELLSDYLLASRTPTLDVKHETSLARGMEAYFTQPNTFDIILLDLSLPDSNHLETLTRLRNQISAPPVIVLTGNDDINLALQSLRSGAQDFLVKGDINERILQRSIRYALERKWAEDERTVLLARELSARADAERAVFLRDEFISLASHELRTPLAALLPQLEILKNLIQSKPSPVAYQKINRILESTHYQTLRLIHLVHELLDVTRIASGRLELDLTSIDLATLLKDIIERMQGQFDQARCPVTLQVPESAVGLFDQYRIEQVVMNLLINALKFGVGKPIEVTLSPPKNNRVRLVIKDHGSGIQKDKLPKIFDRFERADAPEKVAGLGLGLYVVRQIVDAHRGSIQVESKVNEGTQFSLELPLSLAKEEWPTAA